MTQASSGRIFKSRIHNSEWNKRAAEYGSPSYSSLPFGRGNEGRIYAMKGEWKRGEDGAARDPSRSARSGHMMPRRSRRLGHVTRRRSRRQTVHHRRGCEPPVHVHARATCPGSWPSPWPPLVTKFYRYRTITRSPISYFILCTVFSEIAH